MSRPRDTPARLGLERPDLPPPTRVVVDVRPLQEPEHAPITAAYLGRLLRAFVEAPLAGESFVILQRADLPDPGPQLDGLPIAGRRVLPATRFLRAATQTVDPFLVRAVSIGAGWGATGGDARDDRAPRPIGTVYHAAGTVLPFGAGAAVVASLLDLAAWQLPGAFQRSPAARFGARLRLRLLREARIVACGTRTVADLAARRLHVPANRLRVVPLAARDAFVPLAAATPTGGQGPSRGAAVAERERLGLPDRYLVWAARHDARQDLPTLLAALRSLGEATRPDELPDDVPWPPRVLVVEASPADRAALARAVGRAGLGDAFAYAPGLADGRLAALVAGSRAALAPVVSDATGLAAIEAIACGVPVVATGVGALPELVGSGGILVPPRAPDRLAAAIRAIWLDDDLRARLSAEAGTREAGTREAGAREPSGGRRRWTDVALDMRRLYAEAVSARARSTRD